MGRRWDVLAGLCREEGFSCGAEIGTADGRFAAAILGALPTLKLTSVDYWPEGYLTWRGTRWPKEQQIRNRASFVEVLFKFEGRLDLIEKPSIEAAADIPDCSLDFVFIDAGHTCEECAADIEAWRPKVRTKGFITGHDYNRERFPGVVQAVDEAFPTIQLSEDDVWMVRKT